MAFALARSAPGKTGSCYYSLHHSVTQIGGRLVAAPTITMLDIKKIKENPEAVKAVLRAKEVDCDATVDRIL